MYKPGSREVDSFIKHKLTAIRHHKLSRSVEEPKQRLV